MNKQTFERKQHLFRVDIMIEESTQTMALAVLLQMLNNPAVSDFRIVEGLQFGALIEKTIQERNAKPFSIPQKQSVPAKKQGAADTTPPAPVVPAPPTITGPTAASTPGHASTGWTAAPASSLVQPPSSTPGPTPASMPGHLPATGSVPAGPAPTPASAPAPTPAPATDSAHSAPPDSAGLLNLDNLYRLKESGALVRIVVVKGKGIKLSIPCRILNFDGLGQQITIYHVDEKKVYSFSLNEIEDIIT
ncbi:MAG: hypothetical protein K0Q59_5226 [Paenibacillus sp.]|jgi:hypothetical protein|nr:hypothetical protein [Paenibacillus sp.]